MRVFVYKNLNKNCFSVKALDGIHSGKVVLHTRGLLLKDCEFRVSEAGRQRVLRNRRKLVHAGVVGELSAFQGTDFKYDIQPYITKFHSEPNFYGFYYDSRVLRGWMYADSTSSSILKNPTKERKIVKYDPYQMSEFHVRNLSPIDSPWSEIHKSLYTEMIYPHVTVQQ